MVVHQMSDITAFALNTGAIFPNVTLPDFEVRAAATRIQSQTTYLSYRPLVTDETRAGWEEYAIQEHSHLISSFVQEIAQKAEQDLMYPNDLLNDDDDAPAPEEQEQPLANTPHKGFSPSIWGADGGRGTESATDTGPYTPMWQVSPVIPVYEALNYNSLDLEIFGGPYRDVLKSGKASLGLMTHLTDPNDPFYELRALQDAMLSLGQFRHGQEGYRNDPVTMAAYPVFDTLDTKLRKVVGILGTSWYWRLIFENLLPPSSEGYVVVAKNSLGQAETYRIDGTAAHYEGQGDLHDEQFDDMVQDDDVASFVSEQASTRSRSFTAVGLNSDYISYSIHIYPTVELKRQYVDWYPVIYALVVASVFMFTTLLFLCYNYLVERRQKLVMSRAVKSGAIVSSLFPKNIRDRLLESERVPRSPPKVPRRSSSLLKRASVGGSSGQFNNGTSRRPSIEMNLPPTNMMDELNRDDRPRKGLPIADSFKAATIIFADLAGFTNWSSDRKPTDVFGLLEQIYGAFDRIATRRQVFKVETIGDCYVAVTGVPESQDDHAWIMAKFATECLFKLDHLLVSLADEYGPETKELKLRVGLHSGPVTAGVLRGDRSRFQLFGDSVNTAARMESNGTPGRIHCSEETADCLEVAAVLRSRTKKPWTLIPRQEKITPKGKKEMQTYWIQPTPLRGHRAEREEDEAEEDDEAEFGGEGGNSDDSDVEDDETEVSGTFTA